MIFIISLEKRLDIVLNYIVRCKSSLEFILEKFKEYVITFLEKVTNVCVRTQ